MFVERKIKSNIIKQCFKGKVVIIYGPRRVGKTTLVQHIGKELGHEVYFSCDDPTVRATFSHKDTAALLGAIRGYKTVILDEAQRVPDIGLTLKQIIDAVAKDVQIIATGSSSFALSNTIAEPLTGRSVEFHLFPFSFEELQSIENRVEQEAHVNDRIIFGMYPEVLFGNEDRLRSLHAIANQYLYRDILAYEGIRKPELLEKLLVALATSVGSEISYSELSNTLGIAKQTVESYITILEQAFIIYAVRPFHKNLRSELTKKRKVYFYDTGIRNMVLGDTKPLELRSDKGGLWENFVVNERIKFVKNDDRFLVKFNFWRTTNGQEIDLVEADDALLRAFEIKWKMDKPARVPSAWYHAYGNTRFDVIDRDTFLEKIYL